MSIRGKKMLIKNSFSRCYQFLNTSIAKTNSNQKFSTATQPNLLDQFRKQMHAVIKCSSIFILAVTVLNNLIPIVAKGLESVHSIGDVLTAEDVEEIFPADSDKEFPSHEPLCVIRKFLF